VQLELSAGWQWTKETSKTSRTDPEVTLTGNLEMVPLLAGLKVVAPLGPAQLSAGISAGGCVVLWRATLRTPGTSVTDEVTQFVPFVQAGVGLAVPVGERWQLGIDFRWQGGESRILDAEVSLDGVAALAGVGWKF
jgi:hypothetical protein